MGRGSRASGGDRSPPSPAADRADSGDVSPSLAIRSSRLRGARVTAFGATLLALASSLPATTADAAIHACPTEDGTTVFQDRPCERRESVAAAARPTRARAPAGLHESWFTRPAGADVFASCDEHGCRCDAIARPFDSGLPLAVADALYLDGAWHRLEEALAARRRDAFDGPPPATLDRRVDEAACDVMMSQRILRTHATDVLAGLRRRARETEERGYDDGIACETGDVVACEHVDALALYRRMVADLIALRTPRDERAPAPSPRPSTPPSGLTVDGGSGSLSRVNPASR